MGIQIDSVIVCDNLATVLNAQIDTMIGHCPIMPIVDVALKTILALHETEPNPPADKKPTDQMM